MRKAREVGLQAEKGGDGVRTAVLDARRKCEEGVGWDGEFGAAELLDGVFECGFGFATFLGWVGEAEEGYADATAGG